MIVKFLLPQSDRGAQDMVAQFNQEGAVPVATDRMHLGSVRQVSRENGKIMIVAEVTEPGIVKWIKDNVGEGEPIEIGTQ
ncbi:MAG: hypothetical protein SA339_09810 [Methanomassiliicoccus sp.]|nr:hypothetical protein [Methanomassiliicoccus sp.]